MAVSRLHRQQPGTAIAWLRTLLAKGPQPLRREHLRWQPPGTPPARLHLIVLDNSGSMRSRGRLARAKGHAARLIEAAARAGDEVGLLCFGGDRVEWLLPPGPAHRQARARVQAVGGGGGTPLAQALALADQSLRAAAHRRGGMASWLWLLSDGRTLEQPARPSADHLIIMDFDDPARSIGRCAEWAERWGATHLRSSIKDATG